MSTSKKHLEASQSRPGVPTPDLDEILKQPDAVELVEHELSPALLEQGVIPAVYARLTDEARAAILATHISKDRVRAALVDEKEVWGKDSLGNHQIDAGIMFRNELRASLRQQLGVEDD